MVSVFFLFSLPDIYTRTPTATTVLDVPRSLCSSSPLAQFLFDLIEKSCWLRCLRLDCVSG
ncbi:hypothetical protein WH47_04465 [Habropoda laboriosa]|uniref:Uncharacterized protein n=1 Tax=Habropoda laboriosa TaxID=597456 RepID=A0A0L7R1Y6_9HYME|nr:hypothetical protein WH47_04465 [Habropoda laboriosa]